METDRPVPRVADGLKRCPACWGTNIRPAMIGGCPRWICNGCDLGFNEPFVRTVPRLALIRPGLVVQQPAMSDDEYQLTLANARYLLWELLERHEAAVHLTLLLVERFGVDVVQTELKAITGDGR